MIGPDGLLLVVPTYLQSQFQFFGLKKQTWMPEMLLQGHILSTSGDVLRGLKGGRKMPYCMKTIMCRKRVGPEGLMLFARMMTRTITRVNKPENNN